MAWTDRKVAVRIPARSARDILVAGRFALPSMPSAPKRWCGLFEQGLTTFAVASELSAFKRWCGLFGNMFNAACLHLFYCHSFNG